MRAENRTDTVRQKKNEARSKWIPAFAGMTSRGRKAEFPRSRERRAKAKALRQAHARHDRKVVGRKPCIDRIGQRRIREHFDLGTDEDVVDALGQRRVELEIVERSVRTVGRLDRSRTSVA